MAITWTRRGASAGVAPASAAGPALDDALAPAATGVPAVPAVAAADPGARAQAGALLVQLFHYLEQHLEKHPALAPVVPRLRDAVAEYRSGGGQDPFAGVRAVVAAIHTARAGDPALPEP